MNRQERSRYLGGGGTRHVTVAVLREASVAVMTASPGPTWKCLIASGPIVFNSATPDLAGLCVSLIVSPLASVTPPRLIFGPGSQKSVAATR